MMTFHQWSSNEGKLSGCCCLIGCIGQVDEHALISVHLLISNKSGVHYSTQDVGRQVSNWHRQHPVMLRPENKDEGEGEGQKVVKSKGGAGEETGGNVTDTGKSKVGGGGDTKTQGEVSTASNSIV